MLAITGARGFIGSNLAWRLDWLGHELLLVDLDQPDPVQDANLAGLVGHGTTVRRMGHREFRDALSSGQLALDGVFHLGACSDTTAADWDYLRQINLEYTQTLWNCCARRGVPLIYASSAATYGDGSQGFNDATAPAELQPLNLYARSKNEFDRWALDEVAAGRPAPPQWAGVKFFNVYGPREQHKGRMASMVWHAWRQIHAQGEVRLFKSNDLRYPDGGQCRDFVYVDDCLDHLVWLWQTGVCGLFNSGTGVPRTFEDLVKATFAALNRPAMIRYIDLPADLADKYQNFTAADMRRLRGAGFSGQPTSLELGVARYVRWLEGQGAGRAAA